MSDPACDGIMMEDGICSLVALKRPFDPENRPLTGTHVFLRNRLILSGTNLILKCIGIIA